MESFEIGRFYAVTFDDYYLEFIVYDDNTISCPRLKVSGINNIELKPRFVLTGCTCNKTILDSSKLIKRYIIEDALFKYLKKHGMIKYSTDMAYLYDFVDKNGYDNGVRSPYKWAKKKGPILVKQRKGQFN